MPRSSLMAHGRTLVRGLAVGLLLLGGCGGDGPGQSRAALDERMSDLLPLAAVVESALPDDREAILRELAPLPFETLLVVYEVEGPGGMRGTLEVLARPGGYRRENWTLAVPLGAEGERRLDGSTIQTPDAIWTEGDPPERLTASPLGALADAYLALEPVTRRAVVDRLRGLRSTLADARDQAAPTQTQVLEVPCHATRVASIELCLWEATGLPLRYRSDGLSLEAINIDTRVDIGAHAFDLPSSPSPPAGFDADAALRELAAGDLAELAPLLHPGLRLPSV